MPAPHWQMFSDRRGTFICCFVQAPGCFLRSGVGDWAMQSPCPSPATAREATQYSRPKILPALSQLKLRLTLFLAIDSRRTHCLDMPSHRGRRDILRPQLVRRLVREQRERGRRRAGAATHGRAGPERCARKSAGRGRAAAAPGAGGLVPAVALVHCASADHESLARSLIYGGSIQTRSTGDEHGKEGRWTDMVTKTGRFC